MAKKRTVTAVGLRRSWDRKEPVTVEYIKWFVSHQSGDAKLALRLATQWRKGWNLALRAFRTGASSEQVAALLRANKFNVIEVKQGLARFDVRGRSVTFLVLDREHGARQIYLERWASISDKTTNMLLTGMGQKDIDLSTVAEKQIHLCAFELPKRGDYLEISTQSISPILKGIIVFVGATLLAGCTDNKSTTPPPPPPSAPPIPTDPVGNPGPRNATIDDTPKLPEQGIQLPTGRANDKSSLAWHTTCGLKSNIGPTIPIDQWYWFWIYTVSVASFHTGCSFYLTVSRHVWFNGAVSDQPEHNDNPLPGNVWLDGNGLHFIDDPGFCPNPPNPAPYEGETGLGQLCGPDDHVMATWRFRLFVWCPGEDLSEYTFSVTMEIDHGTMRSGMEKPKFVQTRPVTDNDRGQAMTAR